VNGRTRARIVTGCESPGCGCSRGGRAPWAYWDHEDDTIVVLADDSDTFLRGLLTVFSVAVDAAPVTLPFDLAGANARGLPPARDELRTTAQYLALLPDDPSTAERGLLGRCQFHGDGAARAALDEYYAARGGSPPGAGASG
jgi:hypothetical protein